MESFKERPTPEEDVIYGRESGYPECCIQYYVKSRLNPDLPRWASPEFDRILCPECAKKFGGKLTYTRREASAFIRNVRNDRAE